MGRREAENTLKVRKELTAESELPIDFLHDISRFREKKDSKALKDIFAIADRLEIAPSLAAMRLDDDQRRVLNLPQEEDWPELQDAYLFRDLDVSKRSYLIINGHKELKETLVQGKMLDRDIELTVELADEQIGLALKIDNHKIPQEEAKEIYESVFKGFIDQRLTATRNFVSKLNVDQNAKRRIIDRQFRNLMPGKALCVTGERCYKNVKLTEEVKGENLRQAVRDFNGGRIM
jgi:hypothetical protein